MRKFGNPAGLILVSLLFVCSGLMAESFEDQSVLERWELNGGGELSVSEKRAKFAERSLEWDWRANSKLWLLASRDLRAAASSSSGGIKLWIYNEQPLDEDLVFNFGSSTELKLDNPQYSFKFALNYSGWRALWVSFSEDALNEEYSGADSIEIMEIEAPRKTVDGELFLDGLTFEREMPAERSPDRQLPNLQGLGADWNKTYDYNRQIPDQILPPELIINQDAKAAFKKIARLSEEWLLGKSAAPSAKPVRMRRSAREDLFQRAQSEYEKYDIRKTEDRRVLGKGLFSMRSSHEPKFENFIREVLLWSALEYRLSKGDLTRQKLLRLFDYVWDQGYAAGSGLGSLKGELSSSSAFARAVFLSRDELDLTGRLDKMIAALEWYSDFGQLYAESELPGVSADRLRRSAVQMLLAILCQENSVVKVDAMRRYVRWMENALEIAPGYAALIKPDYSGYQNFGISANASLAKAYHIAALVSYLLDDTVFELSEESQTNLSRALLSLSNMANKYDVPVVTCGSYPERHSPLIRLLPAYAYMAKSSHEMGAQMRAAFQRLWNPDLEILQESFSDCGSGGLDMETLGALQLMSEEAARGVRPEATPEGFWFKRYGALGVQRQESWLAAVKGWSGYIWDYAATETENVYGRYLSYGTLQLLCGGDPIGTFESGWALARGWDWNRWPGSTTIHLPLEELRYRANAEDDLQKNFSDSALVGGVSQSNNGGMVSIYLHDPVYNTSFAAQKVYIFYKGQIICLGHNIRNDDERHSTETTLFQNFLTDQDTPLELDGLGKVSQFPWSFAGSEGEVNWLMDPLGNGYVLRDGRGLRIERDVQHSRDQGSVRETRGKYATAWIDHGKSPENGKYEYVVLAQSSPEATREYSQNIPYDVLQGSEIASIVRHRENKTTYYSILKKGILKDDFIERVNGPLLIMVRDVGSAKRISICDPAFRRPSAKSAAGLTSQEQIYGRGGKSDMILRLNGLWQMKAETDRVRIIGHSKEHGFTLLNFIGENASTVEFEIIPLD